MFVHGYVVSNKLVSNYSFKQLFLIQIIYIQLYSIKYLYLKQRIFKQIYLTHRWDTNKYTTPGQNKPGSNGNDGVLNTPQSSRTGPVSCHPQDTLLKRGDLTPLQEIQSAYSKPHQELHC